MLLSVVKATLEEISFEGPPGIPWSSVIARLKARGIATDSSLRSALWAQCTSRADILFRDKASGQLLHRDESGGERNDWLREPFCPENVSANPCDNSSTAEPVGSSRKRICRKSNVAGFAESSRKRICRKRPSAVCRSKPEILLDVPEDTRRHFLQIAPHPELADNPIVMKAFQAITRARSEGAWAVFLAFDLGIIPRDLFYRIEGLRLAGLVLSMNVAMPPEVLKEYHDRGGSNPTASACHSNLLFHFRFFNAERVEAAQTHHLFKNAVGPLIARILGAIDASPSQVVLESDLRCFAAEVAQEHTVRPVSGRLAGRLYQRARKQLQDQQKVEFVRVWDMLGQTFKDGLCKFGAHPAPVMPQLTLALEDTTVLDSNSATAHLHEMDPTILEPSLPNLVSANETAEDAIQLLKDDSLTCEERPLFAQAIDLIDCSGTVGVTSPQITDMLSLDRKAAERLLNELVKMQDVVKVMESDGKMHVNRYLSKTYASTVSLSSTSCSARALSAFAKSALKTKASKAGNCTDTVSASEQKPTRVDATFQRRMGRACMLVEEMHVLTIFDFRRRLPLDGGNESKYLMDRRTAHRILEALAQLDSRVGISRRERDTHIVFAFWKPAMTEAEALQRVEEEQRQKHLERWHGGQAQQRGKNRTQPLAIADIPSQPSSLTDTNQPETGSLVSASSAKSNIHRRVLDEVVVTSLRHLNVQRCNQKVQTFYGYQAPVMVRVQLLHDLLLRTFSLDGDDWNSKRVVDEMDLHVFLQVVGCSAQNEYIDDLLRQGDCKPKLRNLPSNIYRTLMTTSYGGMQRAPSAVRRLLAHLVKLKLITAHASSSSVEAQTSRPPGSSTDTVGVAKLGAYCLCRHVELFSFTHSLSDNPPVKVGVFDFAEPTAFSQFWKQLQDISEAWIANSSQATVAEKPSAYIECTEHDLGERKEASDDAEVQDDRGTYVGASRVVRLPANSTLVELFHKKNWKHKAWLTPDQRVAILEFIQEAEDFAAKVAAPAPSDALPSDCTTLALRTPPRVLTPRSPEILALSRRIGVAPDRIVKHCKQFQDIEQQMDPKIERHVAFSALYVVRYRCHLCFYLSCQRTAIEDHYLRRHASQLPEDESLYFDPDFHSHRAEQAQPAPLKGRRRRRARQQHGADASPSGDSRRIRLSTVQHPESDNPTKQRWGDEASDDAEWLRLLVVAEQLLAQRRGEVPARQPSAAVAAETEVWPLLSLITGRNTRYCRRRIRGLLQSDKKNQRTVNIMRSKQLRPQIAMQGASTGNTLWAMARGVAKTLLLTPHRSEEPWWRSETFSRDVNELVEWVFRNWQTERLVCKFKPSTHGERLPENCKPRYLLTWEARLRLFGRCTEFIRWFESFEHKQKMPELVTASSSTNLSGSLVQVLSDMVANDEVDLTPLWQDEDFYELAKARQSMSSVIAQSHSHQVSDNEPSENFNSDMSPQAVDEDSEGDGKDDQVEHEKGDDENDACSISGFAGNRYGGVQAHLTATKADSCLEGVGISSVKQHNLKRMRLSITKSEGPQAEEPMNYSTWFNVSEDEFNHLLLGSSSQSDPIDPLLLEHQKQQNLRSDDTVTVDTAITEANTMIADGLRPVMQRAGSALARPVTIHSPVVAACDAFTMFAKTLDGGTKSGNASQLLEATSSILKSMLHPIEKLVDEGETVLEDRNPAVPSCLVGDLRVRFNDHFKNRLEDEHEQEVLFVTAVACLEELRLIVPFACGEQFCEVLASTAAPYCFAKPSEASKPPETRSLPTQTSPCKGFDLRRLLSRAKVGRHWCCDPSPNDEDTEKMVQAASAVVRAAEAGTSRSSVLRLMLPRGLVAPAAWVESSTATNSSVLRFLCLHLVMQLCKTPGASAAELSKQSGMLDECEVLVLLNALIDAGFLESLELPRFDETGMMLKPSAVFFVRSLQPLMADR